MVTFSAPLRRSNADSILIIAQVQYNNARLQPIGRLLLSSQPRPARRGLLRFISLLQADGAVLCACNVSRFYCGYSGLTNCIALHTCLANASGLVYQKGLLVTLLNETLTDGTVIGRTIL